MLSSHGSDAGNAIVTPARDEGKPRLEGASPLSWPDVAHRQSEIRPQADPAAAAVVLEARTNWR